MSDHTEARHHKGGKGKDGKRNRRSHKHGNVWEEEETIGLMVAAGVLLIAFIILGVCAFRLKRQLNAARQSAVLMRGTSEPYGQAESGVVVAVPASLQPVPGTLAKVKSVEEGLNTPKADNEF